MYLLVDLDGTLLNKKYNTTYDFLRFYFKERKKPLRLTLMYLTIVFSYITHRLFGLNVRNYVEKTLLSFTLYKLDYKDLVNMFENYAEQVEVNDDVIHMVNFIMDKFDVKKKILLTSTIDFVAKYYSIIFGFDDYTGTVLKVINGKIIGVDSRICCDIKMKKVIENGWFPYIYITDDYHNEINLVRQAILVHIVHQ